MKNCGTCQHWKRYDWWANRHETVGGCEYPLPALPISMDRPNLLNMAANEGEACPVWVAKPLELVGVGTK
jgi:hypothetical protein